MKKLIVLLAAMMTFATTAFAQLGSLSSDLVFTPVTPCRIMDTRNAGSNSGILLAGTTRTFYGLSSSGNYPSQGSVNLNCGALSPATNDTAAIVLNFTTVSPAAQGYITAFPTGASQPAAATVNFTAGSVIGNNATLKVAQTGGGAQFNIFTTTDVHVVADIVGYYAAPVKTALSCTDSTFDNIAIAAGFNGFFYNTSACPANTTAVSANCYNNANADIYSMGSGLNGGVWCAWRNLGVAATVRQGAKCCSVPGR